MNNQEIKELVHSNLQKANRGPSLLYEFTLIKMIEICMAGAFSKWSVPIRQIRIELMAMNWTNSPNISEMFRNQIVFCSTFVWT